MKRIAYIVGLALLTSACSHPNVEVLDFDSFHVTKVEQADVLVDGQLNPDIRFMEMGDDAPETKLAVTNGVALVRELLGSLNTRSQLHYAGTYEGHDVDGKPLTLSGKVLLPASGPIKNMLLVSHFTIGSNEECPSESFPLEGILASLGYAVVMPDYIGYGITQDRVHPYMHVNSTAQSVVDMALAVKPFLAHIGRKPVSDKVILLGYSQGGSTTVAVMDIIQAMYEDQLPIKKVYAGGGPYDLAATFDISMLEDLTGIPCAIPMIVQGLNVGDNLGLNMADFFKPVLLEHYQEWINSKKYTVHEINALMNAKAVSDLMTDTARDKTNPQTSKFYKALLLNSVLLHQPQHPIYIFHSREDKTVPFVNATKAQEYFWGKDVVCDFGPYGSHGTAAIRFVYNAALDLK